MKRIAIVGAGAIGGSIGAYLLRNGYDITLIDQWAAHIEKMNSDGLKITDLKETFSVPVKGFHISEVSNIRQPFDIIYLSVKSYDTIWSTYLIEPLLKQSGFILPAQNGLNDESVARIVGFQRTVGCVPSISAGVYEPGHIIRTDPMDTHCFTVGELFGIITPRVREVVEALQVLGPSKATTNIWGARWAKLVVNCMGNALSGIIGPNISNLTNEQIDLAEIIRVAIGCEVVRVAQALGISVEPVGRVPAHKFAESRTSRDIENLKDIIIKSRENRQLTEEQIKQLGIPGRPSLLQDVIKGRRTEINELNGYITKKGVELGIPTPINQIVVKTIVAIENGELKPDPSNMNLLKPFIPK